MFWGWKAGPHEVWGAKVGSVFWGWNAGLSTLVLSSSSSGNKRVSCAAPIPEHKTSHQDAPTDNLSHLAPATKKRARSDLVQRCNHPSPSCPGWEPSGNNPGILSSLGLRATSSHCWLLPTCYLSEIPCIRVLQAFWSRLAGKEEIDFFLLLFYIYIVLGMLWRKLPCESKLKVRPGFYFYTESGFFRNIVEESCLEGVNPNWEMDFIFICMCVYIYKFFRNAVEESCPCRSKSEFVQYCHSLFSL